MDRDDLGEVLLTPHRQITCLSQQSLSTLHKQMQDLVDHLGKSQQDIDAHNSTGMEDTCFRSLDRDARRLHLWAERVLTQARAVYEYSVNGDSIRDYNKDEDLMSVAGRSNNLFEKIAK